MSRSWKRTRVKGSAPEDEALREEQGDLLADAVGGAFFGEDPEAEAEARSVLREPLPPPGLDPRLVGEPEPWVDVGADHSPGPIAGLPADAGSVQGALPVPGLAAEPAAGDHAVSERVPDPGPAPAANAVPLDLPDPEPADPEPAEGGDPDPTPIPASPWEQKMAWAKERAREGRLLEAEELYRELLRENPDSVRARNNLGILLDERGDHEGAVAELRVARQVDPRNGEVLGNLGAALGALGRYVDAEEALRAAHRMDPSNREIRANLGILYFRKGLYGEAETELAGVLAVEPDHATALYYRGEALNRLGRVDEAIEVLSRAVEIAPGNPRAYHTLGVLYDKKRLPERAGLMYRKARELAVR